MEKDGGSSFKCQDSSAWRKDCYCGTASDFMTAGQSHGQIPAVPKGFFRFVRGNDRSAQYAYCGDATTVPDTQEWTPLCEEFKAKMKPKAAGGSQRIDRMRASSAGHGKFSVEELMQQHPRLKLTLDDFNFTVSLQVLVAVVAPTYTATELHDMPIPTMKGHFETVRPALSLPPSTQNRRLD
jgi:hypothetical protein